MNQRRTRDKLTENTSWNMKRLLSILERIAVALEKQQGLPSVEVIHDLTYDDSGMKCILLTDVYLNGEKVSRSKIDLFELDTSDTWMRKK